MSTKTTIKRIALVAVAALGLGVLTTAPSQAAYTNANLNCSVAYSATAGTAVATTAVTTAAGTATATIGAHSYAVGDSITVAGVVPAGLNGTYAVTAVTATTVSYTNATAGPATTQGTVSNATLPGKACTAIAYVANYVTLATAAGSAVYVSLSGGTFTDGTTTKTVGASSTALVSTPTAGTITATGYVINPATGVADTANPQTVTITVIAAITGTVYSSTSVTPAVAGAATDAIQYTNAATTEVTRMARGAATAGGALYTFALVQKDANGVALAAASTKGVTATLSGVGSLAIAATTAALPAIPTAPYVYAIATASNDQAIGVYADGRAGKSTLTISVNGAVVKTYDFTFWGSVASYSATVNNNYVKAGSGAAYAGAVTVTALDANGVVVPNVTILGSSSTTSIGVSASVPTAGAATNQATALEWAALGTADFTVTPSATSVAGTSATLTFANLATSPTVTKTATVKATGAQIDNLSWAFDSSSYLPGQKATVTFTATDAAGNPVGDSVVANDYTVFTAANVASNMNATWITAGAPSTGLTFVDGKATWSLYVPYTTSAEFTLSGTLATNASLATALQAKAVTLTAMVGDTASVDAANEATDAANAATDAANAAAEAADAATAAAQDAQAAVAELATQVAALIASIKAQITSLTNLVIKIQKKVKA